MQAQAREREREQEQEQELGLGLNSQLEAVFHSSAASEAFRRARADLALFRAF